MAEGKSGSFDPMLRKLIVILGAGASHGARDGHAPPLGKDLLHYLDRYLHLVEHEATLNDSGLPFREDGEMSKLRSLLNAGKEHHWTYEQLIDHELRTYDPYSENLSLLNRLLVAAFSPPPASYHPPIPRLDEAFTDRPDLYDHFLQGLRLKRLDSRNLTFITMNYDLLLEQALLRTGDAFDYFLPAYNRIQGSGFLKIHGSINWWGNFGPFRQLQQGEAVPYDLTLTTLGKDYKDIRVEKDPYDACIAVDTGDPIIAHYAQGKPAYVNARSLAGIRRKAAAECMAAAEALIIGVHPPVSSREDETLWEMFTSLKARQVPTRYVGLPPDTDTVAEVWRFQPVPMAFRDFVRKELA